MSTKAKIIIGLLAFWIATTVCIAAAWSILAPFLRANGVKGI